MDPADTPQNSPDWAEEDFLVVGIGASAGGITALRQLFSAMPADSGMAFVVVLHLAEGYESHLAEILQASTAMPVTQVTEMVRPEPNHVYVIPPAKYLGIMDGHIRLEEPERGRRVPVDLFFRTLADAYGSRAVAVVLSGTGSDGTLGLKRVKERGGLVLVQQPEDAEYDGMPRSAMGTGLVDLVLPVAELAEKLRAIAQVTRRLEPIEPKAPARESEPEAGGDPLRDILTVLKVRTGHDFSHYKRPTLLRRVARRMQVHEVTGLPSYLELLREKPEEVQALLGDLLITVTNFFRDKEAFAALEQQVIPRLFVGKEAGDSVRVWSCGCATGEEAYSLAILLSEYAQSLPDPPRLQVFASDLNEEAIRTARQGHYDETIVADVTPERLFRFFVKEGDTYRVKKELRDLVLFAPHNVLRDPPFSRLDLIVCRNLLIYLNREMQERVLELFHFALRPHGYLFLGSSETAESLAGLFSTVDKKQRLYQCHSAVTGLVTPPALPLPGKWQVRLPEARDTHGEVGTSFAELHYRLLERFAPPSLLVDEHYDIVHASENGGRFLRFVGGEPSRNLLKLVHPALQLDLQAALMTAKNEGRSSETPNLRVRLDGKEHTISLAVHPVALSDGPREYFLVTFAEGPPSPGPALPAETRSLSETLAGDKAIEAVVRRLEDELQRTRDRLRATLEQHETSMEELRASNEELQAINEELRSASEELETSKEELQSVNEELTTVNQELKEKLDELSRANADLQNLMAATDIGTIFLDRSLNIKRYTPPVKELFNIIPSDVGRPLAHLTHKLAYDRLPEDARRVLETLHTLERDIRTVQGERHYLMRLAPYRTLEDRIDGVVVHFIDVSERKRAEEALRESEEKYRVLFNSMDEGYILCEVIFDPDGNPVDLVYLEANPASVRMSGSELVGRRTSELGAAYEPYWFETFGRVAKTGVGERHEFYAAAASAWYSFYVFKVGPAGENRVASIFQDITERKRREARQAYLLKLSDALRPLDDPIAIQEVAARMLGKHLGASRVLYGEVLGEYLLVEQNYVSADQPILTGRFRMADFGTRLLAALEAGRSLVVPEVAVAEELSEPERKAYAALGIAGLVVVPLVKHGRFVANLNVHQATPRAWTPDEVRLIEETAERTWAAVERARAEAALRESEARLKALLEVQQRFVADASHELRTPLAAVLGNLELLRRYPAMPDPERTQALSDAYGEARRMARLIRDLLALARGDTKTPLQSEPVQLDLLLGEILRHLQRLDRSHRLEPRLEPVSVQGDPDRLKELFLILLENALKYTPEGGEVRLELSVGSSHAEVRVSDSGPGIAPEDLPHVFERFYRSDKARSRGEDPGGTGLGLSIAKQIVEAHGGEIGLESQVGHGTTAIVRLPLG